MNAYEKGIVVDPLRPHVRFYKDVVIKSGSVPKLRIEARKTAAAYNISRETGMFRVPEVKQFDEQKGEIVFERIDGVTERRMLNLLAYDFRKRARMAEDVGRCLATIHEKLSLESEFRITVNEPIAWPNQNVFLHGDFDIQNVSCLADNQIVIMDWQMTRFHGGQATYGTYYYDMAWFMMNLFFIRARGLRYSPSLPMTGLATRFARSYLAASGRSADDFREYLRKFFRATIPKLTPRTKNRRQQVYMAWLLLFLNRFITRCSDF